MKERLLYLALGAFALGIALRSVYAGASSFAYTLLLCSMICALWWYCRSGRLGTLFALSLVCLCGALGIMRYEWADIRAADPVVAQQVGEEVILTGVIDREPDVRARTQQLYVRIDSLNDRAHDARVLILTDRYPRFSYGDRVTVSGTLGRPESFETDLGRTFNYPGYLRARGITYTVPFADVARVRSGEGNLLFGTLLALKHRFMHSIEQQLPEPHAGLAEGLVLGVKRALGEDLEDAFRATGIIHIVVLSGYNVTIVAEAIMRLLSYFFVPRTRVLFGIAAIAAFMFIAGLSATVVHASLMAVLVLIARATGRTYDVVRALMIAGAVMLLINPYLLMFDPGFQLSFLATLGLILLAPIIERLLGMVPTRLQIREFVTATIATQLFVLPLLLFSMGELSIVAVAVNVLVLPAVPIAMLLIFLAGALGMFSTLGALPFSFGAYVLLEYMLSVVWWFAALPFASLPVPIFPFWMVMVGYLLLAYILWRYGTVPDTEKAPV